MAGGRSKGHRLEGRRIIVTGAASGIARATAVLFAAEGAELALFDIDAPALRAVASQLGACAFPVDVRLSGAVEAAVAAAAAALGGIDGVVNIAGRNVKHPLAETTDAIWDDVIALNLSGPFYVCRAAAPHLLASGAGTIVNIASGTAVLPIGPNLSVYAASKGGLLSMTKAMAKELAPTVRANVVMPGNTRTPLFEAAQAARRAAGGAAPTAGGYALDRVAEPEEIANAILFLTSSESSFVTGAAFAVDGGRTFH